MEKITENTPKTLMYEHWLARIHSVESMTIGTDTTAALNIVYLVLPIVESISKALRYTSPDQYLANLGVGSIDECAMVWAIYRNGYLHGDQAKRLVYNNATVSASLMSSGGTGGFIPYDAGFESPHVNLPRERVMRVIQNNPTESSYTILLQIDRLAALLRRDVQQMQSSDTDGVFERQIGNRVDRNMPLISASDD